MDFSGIMCSHKFHIFRGRQLCKQLQKNCKRHEQVRDSISKKKKMNKLKQKMTFR